MIVTLNVPDDIARTLLDHGGLDLDRRALMALAIEGYREQRLSQKQVGELLNFSRIETEDFLASHVDLYDYDPSELGREARDLKTFADRPR